MCVMPLQIQSSPEAAVGNREECHEAMMEVLREASAACATRDIDCLISEMRASQFLRARCRSGAKNYRVHSGPVSREREPVNLIKEFRRRAKFPPMKFSFKSKSPERGAWKQLVSLVSDGVEAGKMWAHDNQALLHSVAVATPVVSGLIASGVITSLVNVVAAKMASGGDFVIGNID